MLGHSNDKCLVLPQYMHCLGITLIWGFEGFGFLFLQQKKRIIITTSIIIINAIAAKININLILLVNLNL